jgi:hypothetical protein
MLRRYGSVLSFAILCLGFSLHPASSLAAESFEALCENNTKCQVVVDDKKIVVNGKEIPSSKILKWSEANAKSERKPEICLLSVAACLLLIFHDYQYSVEYADEKGELQVSRFRFTNDKPAKQLVRELTELTNLASDQTNTSVATQIEQRRAEIEYEKMISGLNCSPAIKPFKCSYADYLEATPAAKAWAEANPSLVRSQMIKFRAVEVLPNP